MWECLFSCSLHLHRLGFHCNPYRIAMNWSVFAINKMKIFSICWSGQWRSGTVNRERVNCFYSDTLRNKQTDYQPNICRLDQLQFRPFLSWCHISIWIDLCRCVNFINIHTYMDVYSVRTLLYIATFWWNEKLYIGSFFCALPSYLFIPALLCFYSIRFIFPVACIECVLCL